MTTIGPHKVTCGSLISPAVDAMLASERVNILYSDPPWGDGNLAYWQTMNRKMTGAIVPQVKHSELYDRILQLIARYVDGFVFVETGLRWRDYVMERLRAAGLVNLSAHGLKYMSGSKQLENVLIAAGTSAAYRFNFDPSPYKGRARPWVLLPVAHRAYEHRACAGRLRRFAAWSVSVCAHAFFTGFPL